MDTPTVQSAQENNDATIRCEVKGDPEPAVSWYFNGLPIIREYAFILIIINCGTFLISLTGE